MTLRQKLTLLFAVLLVLGLAYLLRNVPVPPDCRWDPKACEVKP